MNPQPLTSEALADIHTAYMRGVVRYLFPDLAVPVLEDDDPYWVALPLEQ